MVDAQKTERAGDACTTRGNFHWLGALAAGVIAAGVGALLLHFLPAAFAMPPELADIPRNASDEFMVRYKAAFMRQSIGNAAVAFAILGSMVGLAIGGAAMAKARIRTGLSAALLAAGVGALGGLASGFIAGRASTNLSTANFLGLTIDPTLQSTLLHFFCWGSVGLGMGLGIWLCHRDKCLYSTIIRGLLSGLMAAVLHAVIGSLAFPNSNTQQILPPSLTEQLIWACGSALLLGAAVLYPSGTCRTCA